MSKLDELMELNKSVDTIINSAMEDNKKTEAEITATKVELWNKMWDDIDTWYNKGYVDAAIRNKYSIDTPYGYSDKSLYGYKTYDIKLYKYQYAPFNPHVYLDVIGGHTKIERYDYSLINHEYHDKCVTALLLSWGNTKNKIEQKLADLVAKAIKEKTKKTESKINYNNTLLEALKNITEEEQGK